MTSDDVVAVILSYDIFDQAEESIAHCRNVVKRPLLVTRRCSLQE